MANADANAKPHDGNHGDHHGGHEEKRDMLKFSVHHFQLEGVDGEAFGKWYTEEQVPRMMEIIQRHGVDLYHLYLTPDSLRNKFTEVLKKVKPNQPGWKMATFDVTSSYWVDDPEKLINMLADPDWEGKVIKFEQGWIDQDKAEVQVGWETVYLRDNKIVNTVRKEYPEFT